MQEITHHRSGVAGDFHDHIVLERNEKGTLFTTQLPSGQVLATLFQDKCVNNLHDVSGLTNEVLLAMVMGRLEQFQAGPLACPENDAALHHIRLALDALHTRTRRRHNQGLTGQHKEAEMSLQEKAGEEKPRVRVEGARLHVGDKEFDTDYLRNWSPWSEVEQACLALKPLITQEEVVLICSVRGSENGKKELRSALARTSKP